MLRIGIALMLFGIAGCDLKPPASDYASMTPGLKSALQNKKISDGYANIAFNAPESVRYGVTYGIELILSPTMSSAEVQQLVTEPGTLETARIEISNEMDATLSGEAFVITPITPTVQSVGTPHPTTWRWDIRPTRLGSQKLSLSINMHLAEGSHNYTYSVKTFSRDIDVVVNDQRSILELIKDNWAIVTGVGAGIAFVIGIIIGKQGK